jgi:hypothetical protein
MIDRRQLIVGAGAVLAVSPLAVAMPAITRRSHLASVWWLDRIYNLGDKLGWVSEWNDVRGSLLHTVVVTEIEQVESGGWEFGLDTILEPGVLIYPDPLPRDSCDYECFECQKRLWHLSRITAARRPP